MANAVTATIKGSLNATEVPDTGFFSGKPFSAEAQLQALFQSSGTAADQVNGLYAATLSFSASTPQTIDLQSLTDIFGAALSFQRVKGIALRVNSQTDGASLSIAPGASNGNTAILGTGSSLRVLASTANNQGFLVLAAPNTTAYAVSGSSKTLTLTPSAHAFTVDIVIVGVKS